MMTQEDKDLLAKKGISEEKIAEQLACFETGFPYLKLYAAASVENGILAPDADDQKKYLDAWEAYTQTDKTVVKFVPASGAASRMFKNMFEFLGADYDVPTTDFEKKFFDRITDFAFYGDLNDACQKTAGKDIPALVAEGNYNSSIHWGRELTSIEPLIRQTARTVRVGDEAKESFDYLLDSGANYVVVLNEDDTIAGIVTKTSVARSVAENLWGDAK